MIELVRVTGPAGALTGWIRRGSDAAAPPVLLVHPINMQGRIWEQVAADIDESRTLYLPDMRAHGGSSPEGDFGLDEWLSDLEAFLDETGCRGPLHVAGGSLGGSLAVCFAAAHPERTLSVAGIGATLDFEGADAAAVLEMFDEYGIPGTFEKVFPEITFGPDVAPETIALGISLANPNDVAVVKRVWEATVMSDSRPRAGDVLCPSLVLTGEHDATCTPEMALRMARLLRTELTLMPGIGHMPMLESPARVALLLEQHFRAAESLAALD